MKKWYKICGFLGFFLTFWLVVPAQNARSPMVSLQPGAFFLSQKNYPQRVQQHSIKPAERIKAPLKISLGVAPNTATRNYGFFCRTELKTDAVLKFPVRFRLGSVQYCDYMEGKNAPR